MIFDSSNVNLQILNKRAYNLRWATVPEGVIPLTAADPDFPCAPEIAEAIQHFSKDRYFCYGPADGLPEFKESVASYFQRHRNLSVTANMVLPVDSVAYGIYLTCKTFLTSPADEAIIFDPVDFLFRYSIETIGARAVPFPIALPQNTVDFDLLEGLITKNTRMLCLCNPLNPTGKVFSKNELLRIGELACKYNLILLSDEIWSDITFAPDVFTSIAALNSEISEKTITLTGFSKSHGLAGLRIGAIVTSNAAHFQRILTASLHQSTVHGANVLSQIAATAALNKCEYWLRDFVTHLTSMRDLCVKELSTIRGFKCYAPQGCYVAFPNISDTGMTSKEMHQLLLEKAKVAIVPGLKEWFGEGAVKHIRLSFATSELILKDALTRIKTAIHSL
jgi:aminotransferase